MAGYVAAAIENGNEVKIMIEMQVAQSHFWQSKLDQAWSILEE